MAAANTVITVTMNTAIDRVLKVPGFVVGGHLQAELVSQTPAGKGVNVARALARLGRCSTATGFVGEDQAAGFKASLDAADGSGRVDSQLIPVRGSTRESITVVDPTTQTDTHLRMRGYTVTADDLSRLSQTLGRLVDAGDVVAFTGSLPEGMDRSALIGLITQSQAAGGRVVLDLNGQDLGAVLKSVKQPTWMVSPNRGEFMEAVGGETGSDVSSLVAAAREACGVCGRVLLSMGEAGALMVTPSAVFKGVCQVAPGRVINTVSAGDCLLAGELDAQLRGFTPQDALRQGLAVATASTFNHESAMFNQQDVTALVASTEIETL